MENLQEKDLLDKYNNCLSELKELKNSLVNAGYFFENDTPVKNKSGWILEWDWKTYSHKVDAFCYYNVDKGGVFLGETKDLNLEHFIVIEIGFSDAFDVVKQLKSDKDWQEEINFWKKYALEEGSDLSERLTELISNKSDEEIKTDLKNAFEELEHWIEEYCSFYHSRNDEDTDGDFNIIRGKYGDVPEIISDIEKD